MISSKASVSINPQTLAAALGGKAVGNNISAPAPGHSKRDRSLSIRVDPNAPEGFVVTAWAGEDPMAMRDYIRAKGGLPDWKPAAKPAPGAHLKLVTPKAAPKRYYDADLTGAGYVLETAYDYFDADGVLSFQVVRYEHPILDKTFRQRRPDGRDGWYGGRPEAILYRLPDLAARPSEAVYIAEGEKDVDSLFGQGLLSTTVPNGSWPDDLSALKGRKIYVLADNDAAGEKKAIAAIEKLQGIATVRRVNLPDLGEKGDVTDWLMAGNTVEQLEGLAKAAPPVAANQNVTGRFTIDWFGDIEESLPKETFIKGVLGVNEFTMLSGKPGTGKSVIVTDQACHVAAGMEWHGRRVTPGLVVYIAAERKDLTKRRMLAFRKRHDLGAIPLMVMSGRIDLTSSVKDAEELASVIKQAELECGMKCVWIIIDTLTRTFGPGDQNASKDMTKFIQACDAIREAVEGSHLQVIHHTGWAGDRGKGAIDLDGAVDASFMVKKENGGYVLECDGTNDGDEGVITYFRMEGVQVGTDEDGEPTMAPVVVPHDGKSAAETLMAGLSGHKAKAIGVLKALTDDDSYAPQGLWRSAFYAEYPGVDTNTLKSRFKRAKDALIEAGLVIENEGGFRAADTGT